MHLRPWGLAVLIFVGIWSVVLLSIWMIISMSVKEEYERSKLVDNNIHRNIDVSGSTGKTFQGEYVAFGFLLRYFIDLLLELPRRIFSQKELLVRSHDDYKMKVPQCSCKSDQWIVVTTIHLPTQAVEDWSQLKHWCLVVVLDYKTPIPYPNLSVSTIVLTMKDQEQLPFRLAKRVPANHFGRKNLGYLYAISQGAKVIYDVDDDNYLRNKHFLETNWHLPNDASNKSTQTYCSKESGVFNPYPLFGLSFSWPRGFPLERLSDIHSTKDVHVCNIDEFRPSLVQQSLADVDPDFDAIYRLTHQLPVHFQQGLSLQVAPQTYAPLNAQTLLVRQPVFWGLMLPVTVHGRVSDIWRGYFLQRICRDMRTEHESCVSFHSPFVHQFRNGHNYLADFQAEQPLYLQTSVLLGVLDSLNNNRRWQTVDQMLLDLYIELYERHYLQVADVYLINDYLEDLRALGYKFPLLRPNRHIELPPYAAKEQVKINRTAVLVFGVPTIASFTHLPHFLEQTLGSAYDVFSATVSDPMTESLSTYIHPLKHTEVETNRLWSKSVDLQLQLLNAARKLVVKQEEQHNYVFYDRLILFPAHLQVTKPQNALTIDDILPSPPISENTLQTFLIGNVSSMIQSMVITMKSAVNIHQMWHIRSWNELFAPESTMHIPHWTIVDTTNDQTVMDTDTNIDLQTSCGLISLNMLKPQETLKPTVQQSVEKIDNSTQPTPFNPKQRIAIMVVGGVRSFRLASVRAALLKNVVYALAHDAQVDVFFYLNIGQNGQTSVNRVGVQNKLPSREELVDYLKPFNPVMTRFYEDADCNELNVTDHICCTTRVEWLIGFLQYIQTKQCYDQTKQYALDNNIHYDWYMRIRPDVACIEPLPPAWTFSTERYYIMSKERSFPRNSGSGIVDYMWLLPNQLADEFYTQLVSWFDDRSIPGVGCQSRRIFPPEEFAFGKPGRMPYIVVNWFCTHVVSETKAECFRLERETNHPHVYDIDGSLHSRGTSFKQKCEQLVNAGIFANASYFEL